jgi:hypothetical protein
LTAWRFPWCAGLWEKGGEDCAGPEHLRSGDGAGGARVLLLLRRNRARRHQIVSAYRFLWFCFFGYCCCVFPPLIIAQSTCIVILGPDSWLAVTGWRLGGRPTLRSRNPRPSRLRFCCRYGLLHQFWFDT